MKKIMFNDKYGLTAAVLAGTKTQTRRIISDKLLLKYGQNKYNDRTDDLIRDAQYKVGEVVAVAQKYRDIPDYNADLYDDNLPSYSCSGGSSLQYTQGWDNKMFVKADLMPHQIEITKVRVERLQDISDADCLAEGILKEHVRLEYDEPQDTVLYSFQNSNKLKPMPKTSLAGYFDSAKAAYAALIDAISGNGTWERNPYCFCYTFKLID